MGGGEWRMGNGMGKEGCWSKGTKFPLGRIASSDVLHSTVMRVRDNVCFKIAKRAKRVDFNCS